VVGILIGATLMAGVGILDDRGVLHHQVKLFIGMPLAAAILMVSGIRAQVFSVLLGGRGGDYMMSRLPWFGLSESPASFSILDHMDGLCAGLPQWRPSFSHAGVFAWPDAGDDAGSRGARRGHGIPAVEFQAGKNLYG